MSIQKEPAAIGSWFVESSSFGADFHSVLLEQYKLYVETTNNISDRRGTAHTLLLTVNTSLVAVYGLALPKDVGVAAAGRPWVWMIPLLGLIVSATWFSLVRSYRALNSAKFLVILEVEKHLPGRLFDLEREFLQRGRGNLYLPLTHLEQYVPVAFALFYLGILAAGTVRA